MTNRRSITLLGVLLVAVILSGCATAPVSYKARPEAAAKVRELRRIVVAPPDVEVREISAGGVPEKRDDWSQQVANNLTSALVAATGFTAAPAAAAAPKDELDEVRALARLVSVNHVSFLFAPEQLSSAKRPLTYSLGAIDALADAWEADAVLFVFARDAYSSAGRKALVALGFALPAPAIASAMLVERNGQVQWFNYHFAQNIDLRESAGAATLTTGLLEGLPRR